MKIKIALVQANKIQDSVNDTLCKITQRFILVIFLWKNIAKQAMVSL